MEILKKIFYFFVDAIQTILVIASVLMVLYAFVIQPDQVDGLSMYPTFHNKDFLLSNLLDIRYGKYTRGDVVVFHAPPEPDKLYIKRIIGLSGDRIKVQDGAVYLNGEKLDESSYLKPTVKTYGGAFLQDGVEITVPDGYLFVMGDNRPGSSDSREWGFVSTDKLIGKSMLRFYPVNTFEIIKNPFTAK